MLILSDPFLRNFYFSGWIVSCLFCKYWSFSNLFEPLSAFLYSYVWFNLNPAVNYMFKVSNRNTRTRHETCSKFTIKIPERHHWHRSGIFIVSSKHISHLTLVFLLLFIPAGNVPLQDQWNAKAHPELYQKTKMEHFPNIVDGFSH